MINNQRAILKIFNEMPTIFTGNAFMDKVREAMDNVDLENSSIFRSLNRLKEKGVISYECIDKVSGKYRKDVVK